MPSLLKRFYREPFFNLFYDSIANCNRNPFLLDQFFQCAPITILHYDVMLLLSLKFIN